MFHYPIMFVQQLFNANLNVLIMKKNMGNLDKGIRIMIAITIAILYFTKTIEDTLAYILMGFATIFVITSFISFCPLYVALCINTCKVKK